MKSDSANTNRLRILILELYGVTQKENQMTQESKVYIAAATTRVTHTFSAMRPGGDCVICGKKESDPVHKVGP